VTPVPPEVTVYLAAVRAALADLPEEERDDLLADVRPSLVEAAAEGGGNVVARLGPPEEFAAELRAAAGLHATQAQKPGYRELLRRLAADPRVAQVRRLAPIWWVARAYVVVAAIALVVGASWSLTYPIVPRLGSGALTVLLIGLATALSIWLGLNRRSFWPAELVLLAAAIPVLVHLSHKPVPPSTVVYIETAAYQQGLSYNGVALNNVYPYSRDGHLLHDVLLFTGSGTPIDAPAGVPDPLRRVLRTKAGKPVENAFPIRYFDPGTGRVSHPDASPPVRIPRIVTPPLRRR
jgi:uncharacterized membrane protein